MIQPTIVSANITQLVPTSLLLGMTQNFTLITFASQLVTTPTAPTLSKHSSKLSLQVNTDKNSLNISMILPSVGLLF